MRRARLLDGPARYEDAFPAAASRRALRRASYTFKAGYKAMLSRPIGP